MGNQKNNNGNNSGRKSARGSTPRQKRTAEDTETEARLQVEEARRRAKEEAEAEERDKQNASKRTSESNDSGNKRNTGNERNRRDNKSSGSKKQAKSSQNDQAKKPKKARKEKIDHVTEKLREDEDTLEAEDRGDIDPLEYGVEWLETVLARMNFDVEVKGESEDDHFSFDVTGEDAEVLLGMGSNKPRSVEALQTLLSAAIGRYTESRKISLDVGGFRDARSEDLEAVARQLGDMVKRINKPMTIAGYKNHERRVIHNALKSDNGVNTESIGDGIFRKICIKPK